MVFQLIQIVGHFLITVIVFYPMYLGFRENLIRLKKRNRK